MIARIFTAIGIIAALAVFFSAVAIGLLYILTRKGWDFEKEDWEDEA